MTTRVRSKGPSVELRRRAERAEALADGGTVEGRASDPEPLRFAAGLLCAQAEAADALQAVHAERALAGSLDPDLGRVLEALREVARFAARHGPQALARTARSRAAEDADAARSRLLVFWSGGPTSAEDYLSRAMLRPYLEVLRAQELAPDRSRGPGRCPFCGERPALGCLRGGAQGQGAGRFLACALCGLEWPSERILCPACRERDPAKLPCFTSAAHPAVRLEACETCRRYLKSLDLSLDARPIPEVDDLVSLALDLWAGEQGFTRIEPGLAGI